MRFWLTLIAAWVSTFAAFADNQQVRDLDISVTLHPSGEITVLETWDVDTGDEITEIYLNRENLGDIEIRDFTVFETDGSGKRFYENVGEWDIHWSHRQKTGRCGIVHKSGGVELCWGIGAYGHHTSHACYKMTNAVKSLNDYDMLHLQLVSPGLSAPPEHVTVSISTDEETLGVRLDTTNTRIWGFGFYGSSYFLEDGSVGFESSEPFQRLSSVIVLLRFDKGIFHSPSVLPVDFQEHLDEAMEGADFGPVDDDDEYDDDGPYLGGVRRFALAIMKILLFILMGLGGTKAYSTGTGHVSKRTKKRRMKVKEALRFLQSEEAEKLIDTEALAREAVDTVQEDGIVFLDELDKVVVRGGNTSGPDVSREGVQRDLLPIVEGSVVQTRYGPVKTDHILFIAAGAFSGVKPSDLIPELQGRFPIRVELEPLSWENLQQILTEPENSLIRQYEALISTEGAELCFTEEATAEIAKLAHKMNAEMEDIGARRLHTMMEQLLEEISFSVCDNEPGEIDITPEMVHERLDQLVENRDIRRYLL